MHMLSHSFCQRRKSSKRPRDLHIRKVSFSGSSLCSGCSDVSTTSTAAAFTTMAPFSSTSPPTSSSSSNTFGTSPPPRLQDRAFIRHQPRPQRPHQPITFFDDDVSAVEDEDDYSVHEDDVVFSSDDEELTESEDPLDLHFPAPPRTEDKAEGKDAHESKVYDMQEHEGYFFIMNTAASKRPVMPNMPGSRWSESTIGSLDLSDEEDEDDDDDDADQDTESPTSETTEDTLVVGQVDSDDDQTPSLATSQLPNFSYKRAVSAPDGKRPQLHHMDSVEDYIKRGGWKRKGIVFQQEDVRASHSGVFGFSS